jgi:hypothetical protein
MSPDQQSKHQTHAKKNRVDTHAEKVGTPGPKEAFFSVEIRAYRLSRDRIGRNVG